IWN
ncbi:putative biotin synthase, partial [Chlamydia psittaci 84-8471/1]